MRARTSDPKAPIDSLVESAYRPTMEHNSSEHWHQAEAVREAAREIDRIDLYDTALIDYEQFVASQTDVSNRVRDLLALTSFYHREFGVHFEKRHAYREQLYRILIGELETIRDAQVEARSKYAQSVGFGLPRFEQLARQDFSTLPKNGIVV